MARTSGARALAAAAWEAEYKAYAPGIGLIQDEDLVLIKHGVIDK